MKRVILFAAILLLPVSALAQKAYEAIYYTGATQNITATFKLADGYIPACEITTKDNATRKTSRFMPESGVPDESDKLKFFHYSDTGKKFTDYFIINGLDSYEETPSQFTGAYYFNGKSYPITFIAK